MKWSRYKSLNPSNWPAGVRLPSLQYCHQPKPQQPDLLPTMAYTSAPTTSLMDLPAELHLLLSRSLSYPDLLALKHTHPHFYALIRTTVYDRVDWLLERPRHGLPLPQTMIIMKTDEQFCNHVEIRNFMERRRRHEDCVGTCLVIGDGTTCEGSLMRMLDGAWSSNCRRRKSTYWLSGSVLAVLVVLIAWMARRMMR
jgi:hypothetical protein